MTDPSADQAEGGAGNEGDFDEDQDFYEGFEGDDDLFDRTARQRKKRKKRARGSGGASAAGDTKKGVKGSSGGLAEEDAEEGTEERAEKGADEPEQPQKVTYAVLPRSVKVGIFIALIVGVIMGIYVAGGSGDAGDASSLTTQELPEGHPDISEMGSSSASGGSVEGLAELVALVAREPDNLDARIDLGVAYLNAGEVGEAGSQWQTVLDADPENIPALYCMGFYYLALPEPDEEAAAETWSRVVELAPDSPEAESAASLIDSLTESSTGSD